MKSILYLLVKADKSSFKIGITDNLEARYSQLRLFWGAFDLASSCTVSGTRQEISGLERSLHYLLEKWRIDPLIKADGHSEWFSIDCFDTTLELIGSISLMRGRYSEGLIKKGINLKIIKPKPKKNIDDLTSFVDLTELRKNWPSYEGATLDFTDDPDSNGWLWTVDIAACPVPPYRLLVFQVKTKCISLAVSRRYFEDTENRIMISLSKLSLSDMREHDGFEEAYEFMSDGIQRLGLIKSHLRFSLAPKVSVHPPPLGRRRRANYRTLTRD